MAGGRYDSSKTRVQPVFRLLHADDPSGAWLGRLLNMGSRATSIKLPSTPGPLLEPPVFEYAAFPPVAYLNHLVGDTQRLSSAANGDPSPYLGRSESTNAKRRDLVAGNAATVEEARARLKDDATGKQWWVLEGTTMVDCALFAEKATVFIEGKRTERHLTGGVSWDPHRHQVFRNLDCLAALDRGVRSENFYVLLVVDADEPSQCLSEARELDEPPGFDLARKSWPHLTEEQSRRLFGHYLGHTTWQAIQAAFRLPALPFDVDAAQTWPPRSAHG